MSEVIKSVDVAYGKPVRIAGRGRLALAMLGFMVIFSIIAMRLITLGFHPGNPVLMIANQQDLSKALSRPDIVDRNGQLLSTDIKTSSLFCDPAKIVDLDDFVDSLTELFPDLKAGELRERLKDKKRRFVWIKRGLTPKEEAAVYELGLPSLGFVSEPRRVYPSGNLTSHVLGYVDVDNKGLSGVERYLDDVTGLYFPKVNRQEQKPVVHLSLDLGVQHILREELDQALHLYRAKAAAGLIMDVTSGEVIAISSLPDFDPHIPAQALNKDRLDRITQGSFELGSILKAITTAMALDYGTVDINGGYDASQSIRVGRFTIDDYHAQKRYLTVPEIFIHSSNIGAAKMAIDVGVARHQSFLQRLGLLSPLKTELGEGGQPIVPKDWKEVNSMTISYGHGLSMTPLQFSAAMASLVNGGYYVNPTFLKRSREQGRSLAHKVIKSSTSNHIRELMRQNVVNGTGKQADAKGYRVGGKTGTAEKAIDGRYDGDRMLNSFVSVFPSDDPAYLVLVLLDEPQPILGQDRPTAGVNAAPVTQALISRIGAKLGVIPQAERLSLFDEKPKPTY